MFGIRRYRPIADMTESAELTPEDSSSGWKIDSRSTAAYADTESNPGPYA
jgi:hypothetical protein